MSDIDQATRMRNAYRSLEGLSVGDAFGERFFTSPATVESLIEQRAVAAGPWQFTDDTVMAVSVVDVLEDTRGIDPDLLADFFAARYRLDPGRGYGGTAHGILGGLAAGEPWRSIARLIQPPMRALRLGARAAGLSPRQSADFRPNQSDLPPTWPVQPLRSRRQPQARANFGANQSHWPPTWPIRPLRRRRRPPPRANFVANQSHWPPAWPPRRR